ncbi:MAG TPA: Cro/Cl family transcriptional regulator [Castellaniella sp.]|uniref:Cro/Cl family transcriptional regulator n=1 Tax=Castellaniella sp. TaxID=1955812 RepID=UPI002F1EB8E2
MERLRRYLNSLSRADQDDYARRCHTTVGYLRKALSTKPSLDGALARALDEESSGFVRREELRPDIWPELIEAEHA